MIKEKLKLIEQINLDCIMVYRSSEYVLGDKIKRISPFNIYDKIRKSILLKGINTVQNNYNLDDQTYNNMLDSNFHNKKIVVYTCITGNYDKIQEPYYVSDNIDYVMFSDVKHNTKIWKNRTIPDNIKKIKNSSTINRYLKFHPKELFNNEYDYSIYVDGNILVVSDLSQMIQLLNSKYGLGMHLHSSRDCVYDEAKVCIAYRKGNKDFIKEMIKEYQKETFPKKYGLLEASIIVSDLSNNISEKLQSDIYDKLVSTNTYRDQLCIPYVLWKHNIRIDEIGTLGRNLYLNPKIRFIKHNK